MIKIVEGNILDATEDIIAHQVNVQGKMGKGLALQIRIKYPDVYKHYYNYCFFHRNDKHSLLGKCQIIEVEDNKFVANLFGQFGYGTSERQTNYIALEKALKVLKESAYKNSESVALPFGLGCGLAGGNWNIVYQIIKSIFDDYEVTLYNFK